jgi:hypothetical protein
MRAISSAALVAATVACATDRTAAPSATSSASPPLTAEDVEERVQRAGPSLRGCYLEHRFTYGLQPLSDFRVRLRIPVDGGPHVAEIAEATEPGQEALERCVVQVVEKLRFRAHRGEPLVVDVPIRAPKR